MKMISLEMQTHFYAFIKHILYKMINKGTDLVLPNTKGEKYIVV